MITTIQKPVGDTQKIKESKHATIENQITKEERKRRKPDTGISKQPENNKETGSISINKTFNVNRLNSPTKEIKWLGNFQSRWRCG